MDLKIQDYICPGKRAHLVGVGGVSMSPLAQVLHGAGVVVTGSDMHESAEVAHLRALGIPVTIGHLPQSVAGADCVIRTAAVHDDNPEIAAARAAGIPVFERAQAWGALMRHYENALCVAGTHGKTTTTSMCAHIFLAACAAAHCLGIPAAAVEEGLRAFHGAGRRFEKKGEFHGAMVYDDYAHHPHELQALLTTAKGLGYQRIICAFQPHTYSRTHELFHDFVEVLKLPDITLLAEIYAARETNTLGISSNDLAREIPGSIYCPTLADVTEQLRRLAQPGDLILTVGAGDIYQAGEALLKTDN